MNISPVNMNSNSRPIVNKQQTATRPATSYLNFRGNENPQTDLMVKGPSLFNGFDGSIKGNFNGTNVDFKIDQKVLKFLDQKNLVGTYEVGDTTKNCNLNFRQTFNIVHKYKINGSFGDKNVEMKFANPFIKTSEITGIYNSKDVNLKINRKLSNVIRNEYRLTGEINNKKVDLDCKGLFFFGGKIEGTFNGKPVKFSTDQKLNPFIDKRDVTAEFDLNNDDKEDLLFLNSALTINDLFLRK